VSGSCQVAMKRPLWLARCAPVDAVIEDRRWAGKRSATNFSSHSVGHEVSSQCRQSASLLMGAVHYVRNVNFSLGSFFSVTRVSVAGEGRTNLSAGVKPKYRNPASGWRLAGPRSDGNLAQEQAECRWRDREVPHL